MDVFNLCAKISLDSNEYEQGLAKSKKGLSSFMDVFTGTVLGNAVSDGLRNVANGFVDIGKKATSTALAIGKASLDSYGNYEQLVGGVETLYSETQLSLEDFAKAAGKTTDEVLMEWSDLTAGQRKVWNDAADAYKTVGMSMNEYMDTATSFAAALVSSLGGDTKKAADMANIAITDMADNANKMGTNMQSIQDAYNGFAKQNYTMLDNLKLGYGGTKSEMERLVKEASTLTDVQKKLGVTVDGTSLSYSNIVAAIHVVQSNMGILGTTSEEAATTIQGSTASVRAAWENMLVSIAAADPDQDVGVAVDNLVESIIAAKDNIVPRIQEIVPTLVEGISGLVTQLAPYVSDAIKDLEPTIEDGLHALFDGLGTVATSLQPIVSDTFAFLGDAIKDAIVNAIQDSDFSFLLDAFDGIKKAAEDIVPVVTDLAPLIATVGAAATGWEIGKDLQKLVTGFDEAKLAVSLFASGATDAEVAQAALNGTLKASEVVAGLLTGKITLMQLAQTAATKAQTAFNAAMSANPIALIVVGIAAVVAGLAVLYAKNEKFRDFVNNMISQIWEKLQGVVDAVQPYLQAAMEFIKNAISDVVENAKPAVEAIGNAFESAWSLIQTIWSGVEPFFTGLFNVIGVLVRTVVGVIGAQFQFAWTFVSAIWSVATSFFATIWNTIAGIFAVVQAVLSGDFQGAWDAIMGIFATWKDFFMGLWQDVCDVFSGVFDFFTSVGGDIVQGIKDGISAAWEGLTNFVRGLWNGLKKIFTIKKSDIKVEGGADGGRAGGLDYVPYNNYVANLHRGEMVLTAKEAENYRRGAFGGGGFTVQQTIYAAKQSPVELAASTAAAFQRARWALA